MKNEPDPVLVTEHDPADLATVTYRKLIQVAEETGVELQGADQLCRAA